MLPPKPDDAFAESMRSEQHPDRDRPDIAAGVAMETFIASRFGL